MSIVSLRNISLAFGKPLLLKNADPRLSLITVHCYEGGFESLVIEP